LKFADKISSVVPAQAGTQFALCPRQSENWIPACAGMTKKLARRDFDLKVAPLRHLTPRIGGERRRTRPHTQLDRWGASTQRHTPDEASRMACITISAPF